MRKQAPAGHYRRDFRMAWRTPCRSGTRDDVIHRVFCSLTAAHPIFPTETHSAIARNWQPARSRQQTSAAPTGARCRMTALSANKAGGVRKAESPELQQPAFIDVGESMEAGRDNNQMATTYTDLFLSDFPSARRYRPIRVTAA